MILVPKESPELCQSVPLVQSRFRGYLCPTWWGYIFSCKVSAGCKIKCCARWWAKLGRARIRGLPVRIRVWISYEFLAIFFGFETLLVNSWLVSCFPQIWIFLIIEDKLVSRVISPYYFLARSMTACQLSACHGQNKIWPDYRYHTCETCCVLRLAISLVWHHLLTLKWRWIQEPPEYDSYQPDLLIWKTVKGIISGSKYNFNTYSASYVWYLQNPYTCLFATENTKHSHGAPSVNHVSLRDTNPGLVGISQLFLISCKRCTG